MRSKNALKNIVSSLLLQIVNVVCGFIVPKLIIDSFGSATNGLINSMTQFLAYITLLESGFGPVVKSVLYKPIAEKSKKQLELILKASERFFRKIAWIFVAYIAGLCIFFPILVNGQFDSLYTISLLIAIAIGTFAEYYFGMTYTLYLQAKQKTYITSYIQIFTTILTTIVVVILIKAGCTIQVVKFATAAVVILKPLIQNYYVRKKYQIQLKDVDDRYEIKQKWDGLAQHVAAVIHDNTDIVVLSILSNMKGVSVYSIYMLVVKGAKKFIQAFNNGIDASFGNMLAKKEHDTLNKRFRSYELFYHTAASIMLISVMLLITSFVGVYTKGVDDIDYVRPIFGILIALSEYIWAIRLPYSSLTLAAGHFKQTRKGAWIEAIVNIVLSVILVFHFGIVGVAIGTVVAMTIRSFEFMVHCSKHILKRKMIYSFQWIILAAIETSIAFAFFSFFKLATPEGFVDWIKNAVIVALFVAVEVLAINSITHLSELKDLKSITKNVIRKEQK